VSANTPIPKINKSELTKLKEKCALAGFEADEFVLFSKRGFSNELESATGEQVQLYTLDAFKKLLEDLSPDEMLQGLPKP